MKLLVVDDHTLFRESLCQVLAGMEEAFPRLLQAGNAAEALEQARANPDLALILLDLELPGMGGLECLRALAERAPRACIVIVSGQAGPAIIRRALEAGARGYIPKDTPMEVMLSALRLVLSGGTYLPAQLLDGMPEDAQEAGVRLSPRQLEILGLLQEGLLNKQIADRLGLSESTVKVHIRRIFTLLGASNRSQAVNLALKRGIL